MKRNAILTTVFIFLMSMLSMGMNAQAWTVKGIVTDAGSGKAIPGVIVKVKERPSSKTTTDSKGAYSIEVKKGNTLTFSYSGYKNKSFKVEKEKLNVSLEAKTVRFTPPVVAKEEEISSTMSEACMNMEIADMSYSKTIVQTEVQAQRSEYSAEEYNHIAENRFRSPLDEPLSTFSIDVDAASYSNLRRYINSGSLPPADAIRTEELINYFSYDYAEPTGNNSIRIMPEVGDCPWNKAHRLVKIGLKAKDIASDKLPASNLVFLIDVSGSMYGPTRLDLVKSSLKLLINNLRDKDRVAIVVYSGAAGVVLPSTSGADKQKIKESLDLLTAGGSTAGGAGIRLAYQVARNNFITGGNNRVILCTDGDFNVGVSSKEGLESLIEKERRSGVFLTVLGYGMGNYKDNRMQVLAEKGNGNHAYIDNLQEANKVLVNEFGGTMHTVAKDVKLQIEFNPAHVQYYRLIGYESRLLNKEDFNDDTKDAGEMGAGHCVTALYEIIPVGIGSNYFGKVDELKYQKPTFPKAISLTGSKEMMTIKLRYKKPAEEQSTKIEIEVIDNKNNKPSNDFRFAAAVAMYGQLLRDSEYKGDADYDKVISLARSALDNDTQGYRREFVRLVETTRSMDRDKVIY